MLEEREREIGRDGLNFAGRWDGWDNVISECVGGKGKRTVETKTSFPIRFPTIPLVFVNS